ncbi:hypothetical protein N7470_000749 [Penicillium chermesinum]|nr:hypothetical protein N7470_000749 [Penicillium chermesinum]
MDETPSQESENPDHSYHGSPVLGVDSSESEDNSESTESIVSTRSCSPRSLQHVEENGRRYCDQNYFMPNDDAELTRLNIVHQIYLILLEGRLTTAPIPTSSPRILDIGTGPGDWAIEMSTKYPEATIIASDIGVFDAGLGHMSLPNIDFQISDAETPWTYHEPFDLIHLRGLSGAFANWPRIYQQAYTHLKPGGYIEVADADPAGDTVLASPETAPHLCAYAAALRQAGDNCGHPRHLGHLRTEVLAEAGFEAIRAVERTFPVGLWPEDDDEKTIGKMALIAALEGLEAFALRPLTQSAGYSLDEARKLCGDVQTELLAPDQRLTGRIRIMTGRKPTSYAQRRSQVMARAMQKVKDLQGSLPVETDH